MFTIISHNLTLQDGTVQVSHNVHMKSEAKLTFDKLARDSRVTALQYSGQFETLEAARAEQTKLRQHADFVGYFLSFYGPKGLYPFQGFELTNDMILLGVKMRGAQFEGDSFDRESIRDMILTAQNQLGGVFEIGRQAPRIIVR